MAIFTVRIEGVNLDRFVYDVNDLSTVRGGGLTLLFAAKRLSARIGRWRGVSSSSVISSGASSLMLRCDTRLERDELLGRIRRFLDQHQRFRHATFVADAVEEEPSKDAREKVLALNRWRQMQQPRLAVPSGSGEGSARLHECDVDRVRPAHSIEWRGGKQVPVSRSVQVRRQFGRKMKKWFYARELEELAAMRRDALEPEGPDHDIALQTVPFVNDFEQLSDDSSRGNLHHKIAVLYWDGNKFGSIQQQCESDTDLSAFDRAIKRGRREILEKLLASMRGDSGWIYDGTGAAETESSIRGPAYRLETLLWGGDELIWIVPAWKGWEVIDLFYRATAGWTFPANGDGRPLTHAGGVVFCHHNAPIHRITRLARDLAQLVKDSGGGNRFAYEVLESFDSAGSNLSRFRRSRIGVHDETSSDPLILRGDGIAEITKPFSLLRKELPRSKVYAIVCGVQSDGRVDPALESSLRSSLDEPTKGALDTVLSSFGHGSAAWVHIAELWDYIPEA